MAGSEGAHTGLPSLMEEADLLHERLRRVTVALSLTHELIADCFDRLGNEDVPRGEIYRVEAKRARAAARECRKFALRLNGLRQSADLGG